MNYVGKPLAYVLATPEQPDDRDNPLRIAMGNEASERDVAEFSRRFDCTVWDGFGATEGAIIITREDGCPPGSLGKGFPGVAIYNPDTVAECPVATFGDDGALTNADEAIGELVNTTGAGMFAGYYNDPDATGTRLRHGMYWSGDLAYRDADGWIYFAGRSGDWLRVDGENMTTAPIERILQRLTPVNQVAVYAVPDEHVGDQVMAAIVLRDNADLTPAGARQISGRSARLVTQGVAPLRLAHRSAARNGHKQGPQAGAGSSRRGTRGWRAVDANRAKQGIYITSRPQFGRRPCAGMRGGISVFGLKVVDLA